MTPLDPARIKRILVVKWSAMGDVVISSAIMEDLRQAFPNAEMHLNTLKPWDSLFKHDPRFSKIFTIDVRGKERGLAGAKRWISELRKGRYDLILDLQSTDRSRWMLSWIRLFSLRSPVMIGNNRVYPYHIDPGPHPNRTHVFTRMQSAMARAGVATNNPRPVLHASDEDRQNTQAVMQEHGLEPGQYAVFLPGSQAAGFLKRWGAERYARLAIALQEKGLPKVAILGGPDEVDECARIAELAGDAVVNLCSKTSILGLLPLFEGARFTIANDTGTAHVGSSVNHPMTVICGPTDPGMVKPIGDNVVAMQAQLDCINCYRKTCDHHSCMEMITPEMVIAQLPDGCLP